MSTAECRKKVTSRDEFKRGVHFVLFLETLVEIFDLKELEELES